MLQPQNSVAGTLQVTPYNGQTGGSLVLRAPNIEVASTGLISADAAGRAGGSPGQNSDTGGGAGQLEPGAGCGGGKGSSVGQGGSGGGYGGGGGTPDNQWANGNVCNVCSNATTAHCEGTPGVAVGTDNGPDYDLGNGGGAGGNSAGCANSGGRGGKGGGAIVLLGNNIIVDGTVSAAGEKPPSDTSTCGYRPGGGGGSGGSVVVRANTLSGGGSLRALGGAGGNGIGDTSAGSWGWSGGGGGGGRVKVFTTTNNFAGTSSAAAGAGGAQCPGSQCFAGSPGTAGTTYSGTIPPALNDIGCPFQANLSVTKNDNVTLVIPGGTVTYTITISNAGPTAASGVTVADPLPTGISSANWTCVGSGGGTCAASGSGGLNETVNLPVGAAVTYTVIANIASNAAGTIRNTVTASTADDVVDPLLNDNSATDTDQVCSFNPVVTSTADSGAGSLREAIALACPGSTITFASGVSTVTLTSGELAINKNLTIQGPGANLLSVQRSTAGGTPNFRIFNIGSGLTVTLDRLTIANGKVSNDSGNASGGGIYNTNSQLTITNSTLSGNSVSSGAANGSGGGIYNYGGTLTVSNSTISGNSAGGDGADGGGIYNTSFSRLTVTNSTLSGNAVGGGRYAQGGGIYNFNTTVTISNSTLSGNTAYGSRRGYGGGIYNGVASNLTITNSTLSGNIASGQDFSVGGIANDDTVNIRNTIIAGNSANNVPDVWGTFTSRGHNLIGNTTGSNGFGTTGDLLNQNPLLAPLGNYGGPTQTHALLLGSPAIDAGNNCVLTANGCGTNDPLTALTTDQRGFNRQIGSAVDIGAAEMNYALAATGGTPQNAVIGAAFTAALQVRLTEYSQPISGIPLTFTAPLSGASASLSNNGLATTDAQGFASVTATANLSSGGSYNVQAGANGLSAVTFSLTNTCPNFAVGMPTGTGALGTPYSSSVAATPSVSAPLNYRYALANGTTLPAGLTLDANTGAITGTPTTPGNVSFDIQAELFNNSTTTGCAVTATRSINITCVTNPVVTNGNDNGAGSLREALATACLGSTISFQAGVTAVNLTTAELVVGKDLTIDGGAAGVTVTRQAGSPNFRIFNLTSGNITLANLTVSNGIAQAGSGIVNYSTGTVTLNNLTVTGNTLAADVGLNGGAIRHFSAGTLKINNMTYTGNSGGSLIIGLFVDGGTATITNSTFSGNSGFRNSALTGVGGTTTLINCTITQNSSSSTGGSLRAISGVVRLQNTLVADNTGNNAPDVQGTFVSLGHNLIGKTDGSTGFTQPTDLTGTTAAPRDARLGALANNGGPLQTLRPLPGSPAIDAGDDCVADVAHCGDANFSQLTTDQRGAGFMRQVGAHVDIGAVETNYALVATNGTPQTALVNAAFGQPLQVRLMESGNPISGVAMTFAAQAAGNGASAVLGSPNPVMTDVQGRASVMATANGLTGGYTVTASAGNLSVPFALTNGCSVINVMAPVVTQAVAGLPFNQLFTQAGGVGAVNFSLQSGLLPSGLTLDPNGVLSGVPVQPGSFPFVIKATDANGCSGTVNYTLTIGCPVLTLSPTSLSGGMVGANYAQALSVSGAFAGSAAFSVSSGALPPGLTLGANGALAGVPTTVGSFNFTVKATDTLGCFGMQSYTVSIACAPLVLSPMSLPNAQAGIAFTQNLSATGSGTRNFSFAANPVPPSWLTLMAGGVLSGTPPAPGSYSFAVNVSDAQGCIGTQAYTLTVGCPNLSLAGLPQATAGSAYNAQLTVSPVGGNYQFSSADKPAWLTLSGSGALSGTPLGAGTFSFNVTVTGFGTCMQTRLVTLTVTCPTVSLTPTTLPNANLGAAYNQTVTAGPAGTSYSYLVTTNTLPPGLTLNPATGVLSGTPTAAGNYTFVITATGWVNGAASCSGTRSYNLLVTATCPTLTLSPGSLVAAAVGTSYSQSFTASGGTAPYSFAVTAGSLPPGLTLASNGSLSGTPPTAGTFSFTVTATANGGCTGSQTYTLTLTCPTITLTPASLPSATAGVAYNQRVTASPAGSYSYTLATGNLPPGLSLNATTGALSGTATATGSYAFSIKAERGVGCSAVKAYTLVVNCPTVAVNPASLPNGSVGAAYNQTLSATPSGSYAFAVSGGALPGGLTLSSAGVLNGTPTASGTFSFTVKATGFGSCFGTRSYTVTVAAACAPVTLPSLPNAVRGVSYYGDLSGTLPSGSYTFSLDGGALPAGLTLDNLFGALVGTPTASGTFAFTLKATSANGCSGTRSYNLIVGNGAAARAELADYDGDGQADPVLWRAATGNWNLLTSAQARQSAHTWGAAGDVPLLGDYDGDGKTDLAVFRPSNATWYVQRSSDGQAFVKAWGLGTDVPVPGDFDGDGKTDLAVWRGSNGTWYLLRSSDGQATSIVWGSSAAAYQDVPVSGDFDGDGKTDVAVFRRTTGTWLLKRSSDGQFVVKVWGLGTDTPVAADYDGDGLTDLAVWRGKTGEWFVLNSGNGSYQVSVWGMAGDLPTASDYDGDGQNDYAVWRAAAGQWYVRLSGTATLRTISQGTRDEWPVLPCGARCH